MTNMLLIADYCVECCETTDQELNAIELLAECLVCTRVEPVTVDYAKRMMED